MQGYPTTNKPGPEAGWPKFRRNGLHKSNNTNRVKGALKRIEAMIKEERTK